MELQHIGLLCTAELCKRKDFLPYKCGCCEKTFCQDHFRVETHGCEQSMKFTNKAIVCPICLMTVKYKGTHSDQEAMDIHEATECDPKKREAIERERKVVLCEAGTKCKNKLTALNTYKCQNCERALCLKCRLYEDHTCTKLPRDKNSTIILSVEEKLKQIRLDQTVQASKKEAQQIVGGNANSRPEYRQNAYQEAVSRQAAEAAEKRRVQQQQQEKQRQQDQQLLRLQQQEEQRKQQELHKQQEYQQKQQQEQRQQQQQQQSNVEVCGTCHNTFDSIEALFSHIESAHHSQHQSSPREICDVCGKSFSGFEELFKHAETTHYLTSN